MAEENKAGGGAAEATTGEAHFAEMLEQAQGGGADVDAGAGEGAGAADGAGGGAGAGAGADGGGAGGEAGGGSGAADAGAAGQDGKEGGPQYVPKERFDEVLGQLKDLRTVVDELRKGAGKETAPAVEPPWKSKLKPLPTEEGKPGPDGKLVPWDSVAEMMAAIARVENENANIQREGEAAEKAAQDDAAKAAADEEAATAARIQTYQNEHIPALLKEEGITQEQYRAALATVPHVEVLDDPTNRVIAAVIAQHSDNTARFLYRMHESSKEFLSKEAAKLMAVPTKERTAAIIAWVGRMDERISRGLALDGSERKKGGLTNGGASDKKPGSTTAVMAAGGRGAGAGGSDTATGDAHFQQMRAQQERQRRGR